MPHGGLGLQAWEGVLQRMRHSLWTHDLFFSAAVASRTQTFSQST